jgi:dienelactone hydrolase
MVGVTRTGQRSYYYQATGAQQRDSFTHQMAKATLHLVAYDGSAHGFADDETRTRRGSTFPRRVRVRCTAAQVDDKKRASGPASSAYRGREVLAPPQPMLGRQHVMTCLG